MDCKDHSLSVPKTSKIPSQCVCPLRQQRSVQAPCNLPICLAKDWFILVSSLLPGMHSNIADGDNVACATGKVRATTSTVPSWICLPVPRQIRLIFPHAGRDGFSLNGSQETGRRRFTGPEVQPSWSRGSNFRPHTSIPGENILSRGCGPRFLWTDDCSRRNSGSKQDTARTFATIWEENPHLKGGLERNTDQVNAIPSRKAP